MQTKIFRLNKRAESPEAFEARINAWIAEAGDVEVLSAFEALHSLDIVVILSGVPGAKKNTEQELCVLAGPDFSVIEDVANATLTRIEESGRSARSINFVTASKSSRSIALILVEGNQRVAIPQEPEQEPEQLDAAAPAAEEAKQDPKPNAKPKPGAKPKSVSRNRKANGSRTKGDGENVPE